MARIAYISAGRQENSGINAQAVGINARSIAYGVAAHRIAA